MFLSPTCWNGATNDSFFSLLISTFWIPASLSFKSWPVFQMSLQVYGSSHTLQTHLINFLLAPWSSSQHCLALDCLHTSTSTKAENLLLGFQFSACSHAVFLPPRKLQQSYTSLFFHSYLSMDEKPYSWPSSPLDIYKRIIELQLSIRTRLFWELWVNGSISQLFTICSLRNSSKAYRLLPVLMEFL